MINFKRAVNDELTPNYKERKISKETQILK
jgi:hypothetical protein